MSDLAETDLAVTLDRLVGSATLSRAQADTIATQFHTDHTPPELAPPALPPSRSSLLSEVGGYIGAAFVVAAAMALTADHWNVFSKPGQVALLAVPALIMLIAAVALAVTAPGGWVRDQPTGPRRRLVGVLVLAGGGLLAGAAIVISGDEAADRVFPLVLLAVWGVGYGFTRGVVLHLGVASALSWAATALIDPSFGDDLWVDGVVLIITGVVWASLTAFGVIRERNLGIAMAGALAFSGAEALVDGELTWLGYLLLAALAAIGLAEYLRSRLLSALGVGTVALAVVVPQAVIDYTEGSLGAAGALLVCGLSIVAVSVLGMRLHRSVEG
jgi:hypothetical protein